MRKFMLVSMLFQAWMSFNVLNKKINKKMNEYTGIKDYIFFSAQFNRW